jgi:hypothetical protein
LGLLLLVTEFLPVVFLSGAFAGDGGAFFATVFAGAGFALGADFGEAGFAGAALPLTAFAGAGFGAGFFAAGFGAGFFAFAFGAGLVGFFAISGSCAICLEHL